MSALIKVAVLGANGQVGLETCLFLTCFPDIAVIPICRTERGSVLLRRCGLESRCGALTSPEAARKLLQGCDLVVDFSLPHGLPSEVRHGMREVISSAIIGAPPEIPFVYISTLAAYGMNGADAPLRNYSLARSVYAADKRYAEKLARHWGRRKSRDIYVLRLGQVHGELQRVSRLLTERAKIEGVFLPATPSYSVFAFTIAEALVSIANGHEAPGMYTLISKPAWSWTEVLQYYGSTVDDPPSDTVPQSPKDGSVAISCARVAIAKGAEWLGRIGNNHRHLAETAAGYLISRWPNLEQRLEALRRRQQAAVEISAGEAERRWLPYPVWPGAIPGRQLICLSDSRISMEPFARQVRDKLALAVRSSGANSRAA